MEIILLLALVVIVFPIIALVSAIGANKRSKKLEKRVRKLERAHESESGAVVQPQEQREEQAEPSSLSEKAVSPAIKEEVKREIDEEEDELEFGPPDMELDWWERFKIWAQEDWLLKLGSFLLLLGFVWFVTYAFLNDWVGPIGRIAIGLFAGAAFLILGWVRIQKIIHQGGVFLALGSSIILGTVYAARSVYGFFTPTTSLLMMFISAAFVAYASVVYRTKWLAIASLALAGLSPLLTSAPADFTMLFSYLFVVVAGTVWVALITGWREMPLMGLIVAGLYSFPYYLGGGPEETTTALLFAHAFAGLFFATNTAVIVKQKIKEMTADLVMAGANGMFLLLWILTTAPAELRSSIISIGMIAFAVGGFIIYKRTNKREPFYVYAGVAVAMLAAATAAELSGPTLVITYTLEAGIIAFLADKITKNRAVAQNLAYLLAVPVLLSLESLEMSKWRDGIIHDDFFVLFILALTLGGLGLYYKITKPTREEGIEDSIFSRTSLMILSSLYVYAIVWLSLHSVMFEDTATMLSLVFYTIVALVTYYKGHAEDNKILYRYGAILLGFVVARLLLVDVWEMEITGRIITFFAVGALLVSTAFMGRENKEEEPTLDKGNK